MKIPPSTLSRAQGCLLGQLAGDSLGSLVEFQTPNQIARQYPNGVRQLADGGVWKILAGQPTDDSEMALMLARSLVKEGRFDPAKVKEAYLFWLDSDPFDCGGTIASSLRGHVNPDSQANGALMRISPLGIFGAGRDLADVAAWSQADAALTHVHPICQQVNALFTMAIAWSISTGPTPAAMLDQIDTLAREMKVKKEIIEVIVAAKKQPPADFMHHMGWVLLAFQNALYQLRHTSDLESGVTDTVGRGGDTDTNAAICGALLGAVHGRDQIPQQWEQCILNCRPDGSDPVAKHARPEVFWPVDALELVEKLLQ